MQVHPQLLVSSQDGGSRDDFSLIAATTGHLSTVLGFFYLGCFTTTQLSVVATISSLDINRGQHERVCTFEP
jgi:hypothetical protein